MKQYTAVIIGGGPAGHACAVRVTQLGGKAALVERDFIGGICTNWGCTPSKSMIESAKIARVVRESGRYGIDVTGYSVDFKRVAQRRDDVIRKTRAEQTQLLQHFGVDIYQGEGQITAPGRVSVRLGKLDSDGESMHFSSENEVELQTEHIVLATGSRPLIPGFIDALDPTVVSSNRLISIDCLPETLTIVGGGVIGLEFATIFSNLGSKVTIVEFLERVLATMDPEISAEITRLMESNGVKILTAHKVTSLNNGVLHAENLHSGEAIELRGAVNLIAIGRQAVVDADHCNQIGLEVTRQGITVNDTLQTNLPKVWAVGDATGKSILAHVGIQQGMVCAENIMAGAPERMRSMDYSVIPAVIYTTPEVVGVGNVPADLTGVEVIKVPFSANLRASIEAYDEGFIKLWIKESRVVAAQAIGHNVSEIMQELANMIALRTDIRQVADIIHAHPTYAEIIRTALLLALGRAVDTY
ncbi:MAG: NAD(P)/FAD-dependent oxidoreductase [Anaerolineaceae bacterium]|nr:NAD(P)/FAD-dependent oxidoreductase [Anaerolineaceae bacterium]